MALSEAELVEDDVDAVQVAGAELDDLGEVGMHGISACSVVEVVTRRGAVASDQQTVDVEMHDADVRNCKGRPYMAYQLLKKSYFLVRV